MGVVSNIYNVHNYKNQRKTASACWMPSTSATNHAYYRPRLSSTPTHQHKANDVMLTQSQSCISYHFVLVAVQVQADYPP